MSGGGNDTIVHDIFDTEKDAPVVENQSLSAKKNNLRTNLTPNFTDEYRY